MPTISWDETKPAGADSISIGDNQLRSDKSAIRIAIDAEHVFPASGGDAGIHRLGSARPHYGLQSLVSSTGSDGRLMLTSDTSRLFGVGSGGTVYLGGAQGISAGSYPGSVPQRAYWAEEFGEGKTVSGTTIISFPNSGFSGKPFVQVTGLDNTSRTQIMTLQTVSATQFTVRSSATDLVGGSTTSFFWRSIGTRVL